MGLFDSIFGRKKENREESNGQADKAANDSAVQSITEQHTRALGVPSADERGKPLSDEQIQSQEKAVDEGGSDEGAPSGQEGESSKASLTVKPYEGTKKASGEGENEEGEEQESQEGQQEEDDENFLDRIQVGEDNEEQNAENSPKQGKIERRKAINRELREGREKDAGWKRELQASNFEENGRQKDLFATSGLDKAQTALSAASGGLSVASSGVDMFGKEGFIGKKMGVSQGTSDKLDTASASLGLASDAASLAEGGIATYKNIRDMRNNDEFTTDNEKTRQKLSLTSGLLGMGSSGASMGGNISKLAGSSNTSNYFSAVSNGLGMAGNALEVAGSASTLKENAESRKKLEEAMNDGSSSDQFKKLAGVAMEAHQMQRTSAAINTAKSATGIIKNATGLASDIGKTLGVDENSSAGKALGYVKMAGSVIGGIGSLLGVMGTVVKKVKKSSRKEENIDKFINTGELTERINKTGKYKLENSETRKVAKTVLGYKTSDEMFSAILLNYAATIRANAENGNEKDKYRMLISGLGFKLEGNSGLPSVDAIAEKLSAANV